MRASLENQVISNFRVMEVRDTRLQSSLSKNIKLTSKRGQNHEIEH